MSNRKTPLAAQPGPKGNRYTAALRGPSFPGRRRRGPEGGTRRLLRRRKARPKASQLNNKQQPNPKPQALIRQSCPAKLYEKRTAKHHAIQDSGTVARCV